METLRKIAEKTFTMRAQNLSDLVALTIVRAIFFALVLATWLIVLFCGLTGLAAIALLTGNLDIPNMCLVGK